MQVTLRRVAGFLKSPLVFTAQKKPGRLPQQQLRPRQPAQLGSSPEGLSTALW